MVCVLGVGVSEVGGDEGLCDNYFVFQIRSITINLDSCSLLLAPTLVLGCRDLQLPYQVAVSRCAVGWGGLRLWMRESSPPE